MVRFSTFGKDEIGSVALVFGLAILPLLLAVGAAVDYSRAMSLKTKLQSATDAATLAAAKKLSTHDQSALTALAQQIIASQTSDPTAKVTKLTVASDKSRIEIASAATSTNAFMQIAGMKDIPIAADAATAVDNSIYEIALVLDNSGSMAASAGGSSKIQALRDAANQLIDTTLTSGTSANRTKISIVPFTLSVQVGAQHATANWMDRTGQSPAHWQNFDLASSSWKPASRFDIFAQLNVPWAGCVESRPGNWGVTDAEPTSGDPSSLFVPMLAPDEPGDAGSTSYSTSTATWNYPNSYIGDNPTPECAGEKTHSDEYQAGQSKLCKYRNAPFVNTSSGRGPNFMCDARPLVRLTTDLTALHGSINAMVPGGNTNLFEGVAWGWRTLSPNAPFADGKAYNTLNLKKIIVLMTDGMNAWGAMNNHNGSRYSPFGYYTNARLGTAPTNANEARAQIDAKTLATCTNAKAQGIAVYTVGFSVASDPIDAGGLDLLRKCATSSDMAYVANDSTQFLAAFDEIARKIGALRLTQ